MIKLRKYIFILFFSFFLNGNTFAKDSYFLEGKKLFNKKEFIKSKFKFEKDIVFNPKNEESYLYLAKIYKIEENEKETEKNLNSTLLIDPSNEEAMYMKMDIELTKSNFSKVKELKSDFEKICDKLCDKITSIQERLKNFDSSNES